MQHTGQLAVSSQLYKHTLAEGQTDEVKRLLDACGRIHSSQRSQLESLTRKATFKLRPTSKSYQNAGASTVPLTIQTVVDQTLIRNTIVTIATSF